MRSRRDYPRVLEVTPSHPAIPDRDQRRLLGANDGSPLSRGARRRIRRAVEQSTVSVIATCRVPAPDDSDSSPEEETNDRLRAGGDLSATVVPANIPSAMDDSPLASSTTSHSRVGGVFSATSFRQMVRTPAEIFTLETSWAAIASLDLPADIDDTWDMDLVLLSTVPDPSNLAETARHASRLLDAFSTGATPPVAGALSNNQQRLLSAALTSILSITQDDRVHAAVQTDALPVLDNIPDGTCVVCFEHPVDRVLVPCGHLVLCAVCIGF